MTKGGDAQILEVVGRQSGQQFSIDVILAECRFVLLQTQGCAANSPGPVTFKDINPAVSCHRTNDQRHASVHFSPHRSLNTTSSSAVRATGPNRPNG